MGNVLIELLNFRKAVIEQFRKAYYEAIQIIDNRLLEQQVTAPTRIVKNYAAILAPMRIALKNGLVLLPLEADETASEHIERMMEITTIHLIDNLITQATQERENEETFVFWECFSALIDDGKLKQGYHFDIKENLLYFKSKAFDDYISILPTNQRAQWRR